MSYESTTWAWKQDVGNGTTKLILLKLADIANEAHDFEIWCSTKTIAQACNLSQSAVVKHMQVLTDMAYLTLIEKGDRSQQQSNRYRLNVGSVVVQVGPGSPSPGDKAHHQVIGSPSPHDGSPSPGDINKNTTTINNKKENEASAISSEIKRKRPTDDQVTQIVNMFHEYLPHWPAVSGTAFKSSETYLNLCKRWRQEQRCSDMRFWAAIFEAAQAEEFWNTGRDGKPLHNCRLAWLLTPSKFKHLVTRASEMAMDND